VSEAIPHGSQAIPHGSQAVGEVSPAAEAFGVHPGMRLGEALARCPRLTLVPPDPAGVADAWERVLARLESIGAAVESERPGLACFEARGLLRLHGGIGGVLTAVRRTLARGGGTWPARYGVAPSRFAAVAAASRARMRRPVIVWGGREQAKEFLAGMPVALLRARPSLAALPEALERLGVATLGELAELERAEVADRFGSAGRLAHELACGGDGPVRPRPPGELVRESVELPEAGSGAQLESALGLLIDRLLARRERRGRTLRAVALGAVLVEDGGTWREQVVFREALADPVRMRLALAPRLTAIPAPVEELRLSIMKFGPPAGVQRGLLEEPAVARVGRLREAIRQARIAAGPDAALRVLKVEPGSRLPERRTLLAPFER
jgi:protein ImuB